MRFEGIWVPLVTPFREGQVDHAALAALAKRLAEAGVAGLMVCGTTGEPATLSRSEQDAVLATVLVAVQEKCPVLMGIAGYDTATVAADAEHFSKTGIAGLLVTAPYYVRPSQEGLRLHFEAVAKATALPIVIYNIPYRTGVCLELETLQALARNPQFAAIKECGASLERLTRLVHETPLSVLTGEDDMVFITACLGGAGAVAASAHVFLAEQQEILRRVQAGDVAGARRIHLSILPGLRLLFSEPNPAPLKAVLALQGDLHEELRLPMTAVSAACRDVLRAHFSGPRDC